ncbi:GTPase [Candidatus Magnetomorum sp. HK-1]|nr:GTPase [Candidatus Magnetomorum sp. HK-1]
MNRQISKEKTDSIIRRHVWASMSVSLIPIPLVDFTALTAIQFNMIRKISKLYGIPLIKSPQKTMKSWILMFASFADDIALAFFRKTILPTVTLSLASSFSKAVPVAGQTIGVVSAPIINGAFTYALGKVFIMHFETGGTFMTFDPEKAKEVYEKMFKEGINVANEMKNQKKEK